MDKEMLIDKDDFEDLFEVVKECKEVFGFSARRIHETVSKYQKEGRFLTADSRAVDAAIFKVEEVRAQKAAALRDPAVRSDFIIQELLDLYSSSKAVGDRKGALSSLKLLNEIKGVGLVGDLHDLSDEELLEEATRIAERLVSEKKLS